MGWSERRKVVCALVGLGACLLAPTQAAGATGHAPSVSGFTESVRGLAADSLVAARAEYLHSPTQAGDDRILADAVDGTIYESVTRYRNVSGNRVADGPTEVIQHFLHGATFLATPTTGTAPRAYVQLACGSHPCGADGGAAPIGLDHATAPRAAHRVFPSRGPADIAPGGTQDRHREAFVMEPRIQTAASALEGFRGEVEVHLWEMTLEVTHPDGTTRRLSSGAVVEPLGPGLQAETVRFLHFVGRLHLFPFKPAQPLEASWRDVALELDGGRFTLQNASFAVVFDGRSRNIQGGEVILSHRGLILRMRAPAAWGEPSYSFEASGDIDEVWVDGHLIARSRIEPSPPVPVIAVAAASAMAIVVAGLWLTRSGALWGLWSMRTRVNDWSGYVDRTLLNGRRERLFQLIQTNPGIQPYQLWHRVGGAFGTTLRSLERLERVGLVRSFRRGKFRHYFDPKQESSGERIAILGRPQLRATYDALQRYGPASEQALRAVLGISHAAFSERLSCLLDAGLAVRVRSARRYLYSATTGGPALGPPAAAFPEAVPAEASVSAARG